MKLRLPVLIFMAVFLAGAAFVSGCAKNSTVVASQPEEIKTAARQQAPAGEEVKEFDLNHDKKTDVWVHLRRIDDPAKPGAKNELTALKEMDINFDGKVDIWKYFNDKGEMVKECFDLDFDGRLDECVFYENGVVVRKELDLNFDGKPDLFKFYEKGKLVRKEKSSKGDGRIDTWEYYENEELDRIGTDTNGDGQVEVWQKKQKQ